ncbi:MAG TPA: neutral/alkaline non-lysosomal ceramidase N-terminal domain-containing protein [Oligoflexus sp.]|uniref:neutral/alkaline non-lysosomal ceramidase N-terminal domain-containing protein n=1 Tax=Oligoflexus sp. TaxID=1971216 RepID=UPI002D6FC77E|nr:neutral/alkaline non-lysosomal ceramidase N-terminal domain-containing protein [Oligoflexus sp.]HYX37252.1 neutral/alkaline non-lysosomal ceramidase N-terminal domain-containing protein [Oligoflexus sp.]
MIRKMLWVVWGLGFAMLISPLQAAEACSTPGYRVGAAQDDITGPVAELGMLGYADLGQVGEGLHMRLRSRTLVVSNGCGQDTVAMVIADQALMFHGIKQAVLNRLNLEIPGIFNHRNLVVSVTHTHAGPGGYAHHALYNVTTFGFSRANFDAIVAGTVKSVVKAWRLQQPARLLINRGELEGIQFNRSPEAYQANPDRQNYAQMSDPEMIQIKAVATAGRPLASFNWFAVHGVSLPLSNKFVSGDNKGLAAYTFEKNMGATYLKDDEFVAGFIQANSGDISPYDVAQPMPADVDGYPRNSESADAQYKKAFELFQNAQEEINGPLSAVHSFVDMPYQNVEGQYTGQGQQKTCNGALGVAFAAGTENGAPVPIFKEGTVYGIDWPKITLMPEEQACHAEKVILLPTGFVKPHPWTARIAPFQMLRIGQLVVVAAPFEITTMAGRRLKKSILDIMRPAGVKYVALTALANEYQHYVTTREEYSKQNYEGGSTLFGPWTLAAYTQVFSRLGVALRDGQAVEAGPTPPDLSDQQLILKPGVVFDTAPIGKDWGDLKQDAERAYAAGSRIEVKFWGAHPNNSLQGRDRTLLTVQKMVGGTWQTVRYDWDPDTFYRWQRDGISNSLITLTWASEAETPEGLYRLCHYGHGKQFFTGIYKSYTGCSRTFELIP